MESIIVGARDMTKATITITTHHNLREIVMPQLFLITFEVIINRWFSIVSKSGNFGNFKNSLTQGRLENAS